MPRRYVAVVLLVSIAVLAAMLTTEIIEGRTLYRLLLSLYWMVISIAGVVSLFGDNRWRPAALGTAIFGAGYFVFMLIFQFGFTGRYGGRGLAGDLFAEMKLAFVLLAIACLGTQLAVIFFGPRPDEPEKEKKPAKPRPEEKLGPLD